MPCIEKQNPEPTKPLEIVIKNCSREELEDWIRELSQQLNNLGDRFGRACELISDAKRRGYLP